MHIYIKKSPQNIGDDKNMFQVIWYFYKGGHQNYLVSIDWSVTTFSFVDFGLCFSFSVAAFKSTLLECPLPWLLFGYDALS